MDDLLTNLSNLNESVAMLRVSWCLQGVCGGEFFEYLQCSPGHFVYANKIFQVLVTNYRH